MSAPKTIRVEPGSELDRLLDQADERPIVLEKSGVRYRLDRIDVATTTPASTIPPSPEQIARSIAGINVAAGAWKDLVDAEAFTAYIRERRRTANRPSVKL